MTYSMEKLVCCGPCHTFQLISRESLEVLQSISNQKYMNEYAGIGNIGDRSES